ncbi:MAG: S8 family serine peptidase [Nitrospirae bacterium]|nr:S8 family serine peptidase [Nitrospirota bacterium]
MHRPRRMGHQIGLLFCGMIILLGAGTSLSSAAPVSFVPGEILVKFRAGTPPETVEHFAGRMKTAVKRKSALTGVQLLSLPTDLSVEEAVDAYQNHPDVLYAEPNYVRRAFAVPSDPLFDRQWGLDNTGQAIDLGQVVSINGNQTTFFNGTADADIDAPEAWDLITGPAAGMDLIIAVIDSGVDYGHFDLDDNIWDNAADSWNDRQDPSSGDGVDDDANNYPDDFHGWNFVGGQTCTVNSSNGCDCTPDDPIGNNDPTDDNGHGTHVSGIVAAEGDNGIGITGLLWNAKILPLKILDANGCGSVGDEVQAIEYAIAQIQTLQQQFQDGARQNDARMVINASFGDYGLSSAEDEAIEAANRAGIVLVAAAGNDASEFPVYPAGSDRPNVISVAASDADDRLLFLSNFGKNRVDIAAPGDCIFSTMPRGQFALRDQMSCLNAVRVRPDYSFISGTSMAAPHVSGAVGLLLSQDPSLTPEEVRAVILGTAEPKDALKGLVASAGRLNVSGVLRRVKGSGLIGGGGGCGFPIGMIRPSDRGPTPPVGILVSLLGIFWPLLIPIVRKLRRVRRPGRMVLNPRSVAASAGLLAFLILWPSSAAAAGEDPSFHRVHSLALKVGHHRYVQSEYLDTNSGLIARGDLAGLSGELEYDWRWKEDAGLSVSAGRYHADTDLKNVCCSSVEFSTRYLLLTTKYHAYIKPVEWYLGAGVGFYDFTRRVHGFLEEDLSARVVGVHGVIGLQWTLFRPVTIFSEARYALAKVKHADALNDALDVGGLNYFLGIRWNFLRTAVRPSPAA